ncbi:hypothetical protein CAT7_08605 [Carnobacterium sp. AT7]|uniref:nucleotidyltransferase domain-containing protein n=1 Tax=Carnobacterium TaxID=2747 RepID=UPI00015F38FA|nr:MULTISPECIES: nucleotidyltransferase domain-containing protein [Carnobacterium]EDP67921.1 hypothetical protein CAT7_08605 [Carnobacterium sp. AT7]
MNEGELAKNRHDLLNVLIEKVSSFSGIEGIFLGGSIAAKSEDPFSDIDLRILLNDSYLKKEFIQLFLDDLSEIMFIETRTTSYAVIHFNNFIKLDIFVYYKSDLMPNIWLQNIFIIFDKEGFLNELKNKAKELVYRITQNEFDELLSKYFAFYHELYRRKERKEYNYCESCTVILKNILVAFWYVELGYQPNSLGDWSKYEGNRSKLTKFQLKYLDKCTPVLIEEIESFMKSINKETLKSIEQISNHYHLSFNKKQFIMITSKVL